MQARRPPPQRERGFTYLMLLWWVAISGVMLMALAQSWSLQARREREAELVFRGQQIAAAMASYQAGTPDGTPKTIARLEDLLEDRRQGVLKRHLRQLWPDPITGGDWGLVRAGDAITGVHSTSTQTPLAAPAGVTTYQDWRFGAATAPAPAPAPASAAPRPTPVLEPAP